MKGRDKMTVSTVPTALHQAITDWGNSFKGVTRPQAAGDVASSVQDLCIDTHLTTIELPATLYDLYVEAKRRAQVERLGTFSATELIDVANRSLREL
ncbi:MAG TPA: hypothetical protein VFS14_03880 [Candidatus Saccharimonadales bacterium]|nr:hypothetical protein [Candidatus Saccharimonadales bacterium]